VRPLCFVKIDLVSEQHLEAAESRLRAINGAADLVRCARAAVDPALLFGRGGYRLRDASGAPLLAGPGPGASAGLRVKGLALDERLLREGSAAGPSGAAVCSAEGCDDPSHGHGHPRGSGDGSAAACAAHDASIRTVALRCEVPLSAGKFTAWVEGLLWEGHVPAQHAAAATGQQQGGGGSGAGRGAAAEAQQISGVGQAAAGAPATARGGPEGEVLRLKGLVDVAGSNNAHMVQVTWAGSGRAPAFLRTG
jgi:hypothetical protein